MRELIYKLRLVIAIIIFVLTITAVVMLFLHPELLVNIPLKKITIWLLSAMGIFFLLFGRLGCSLVCPFGIFQEIICLFKDRMNEKRPNWFGKYIIMAISVLLCGAIFAKYKEVIFNNLAISLAIFAGCLFVITGVIAIFKDRLFCTHICPCGTFVGLISKISLFKMVIDKEKCVNCGICERNCISCSVDSLGETIDNETCVKCLKCLSDCPKEAISFSIFKK